ncbi:MAG: DNA primase [Candidatus Liptonbacteria bacterium]|nr:DNA primase [Candidatus Liptonbacteria bacterium]
MAGSPTELIKEKLDVVEFLRGHLELQPAGKNFKALCPFHKEKTPSFMVSPERQTWHCFGCGLGGDIFSFLMRYENLEFGEALRTLAERAGVELASFASGDHRLAALLYEINRAAAEFFKRQLAANEEAKRYLAARGLKEETIETFELGWAPYEAEALGLHLLQQKGFYPEDILRAGVAVKTERGLQIDRFRGRIMFPIHNHMGKVAGFTGRVFPAGQHAAGAHQETNAAKYMNSPESPIFLKSKILYGFWRTKDAIRKAGAAFLVEGQMDMLASWQAGIPYTVASSGTALTAEHLRALGRVADEVRVSFDADEAGLAAGERAIDLAEEGDFNVKVVLLPGFKDPAEAAEKNPEAFANAVNEARPAEEFYFARYLPSEGKVNPGNHAHLQGVRAVLEKLARIASPVRRSVWIHELAARTALREEALVQELERLAVRKPEKMGEEDASPAGPPLSRWELLSQYALAAAFSKGDVRAMGHVASHLAEPYREIFALLASGQTKSDDPALDARLNAVLLLAGSVAGDDAAELLKYLKEEYARGRRATLAAEVKDAEAKGDAAALAAALKALDAHFQYEENA